MMDWATISAMATAGGTLVLAVATFASVRSANRSARLAERAFHLGLRPLLMPSRLEDPDQKIRWVDNHWAHLNGGRAYVEVVDGHIYLAMSVRNAANGFAVLRAWYAHPDITAELPPERDEFRPHMRDLYIASRDIGFWQAAIRDPNDGHYASLQDTIEQRRNFSVDILYGDHEGGQMTISRFTLSPPAEGPQWLCSVIKHWNVEETG